MVPWSPPSEAAVELISVVWIPVVILGVLGASTWTLAALCIDLQNSMGLSLKKKSLSLAGS